MHSFYHRCRKFTPITLIPVKKDSFPQFVEKNGGWGVDNPNGDGGFLKIPRPRLGYEFFITTLSTVSATCSQASAQRSR